MLCGVFRDTVSIEFMSGHRVKVSTLQHGNFKLEREQPTRGERPKSVSGYSIVGFTEMRSSIRNGQSEETVNN